LVRGESILTATQDPLMIAYLECVVLGCSGPVELAEFYGRCSAEPSISQIGNGHSTMIGRHCTLRPA
jgi:hypothetical protein